MPLTSFPSNKMNSSENMIADVLHCERAHVPTNILFDVIFRLVDRQRTKAYRLGGTER